MFWRKSGSPLLKNKTLVMSLGFMLQVNTGTPLPTSTRHLGYPKAVFSISYWLDLVLHAQHSLFHPSCWGLLSFLCVNSRSLAPLSAWNFMPGHCTNIAALRKRTGSGQTSKIHFPPSFRTLCILPIQWQVFQLHNCCYLLFPRAVSLAVSV